MEPSSTPENKPLPEGVSEADLVDGPKVHHLKSGRATFLPPDPAALAKAIPLPLMPSLSATAELKRDYPAAIELALDVLSARLLGLIALVTACIVWGGVIWDPTLWRVIAASAFSLLVFLPVTALYWRAGLVGEKSSKGTNP
jgi:hypothetical protein